MIKGLYFKLNMDKQYDKEIYNFFIKESESKHKAKIDLLYDATVAYKVVRCASRGPENENEK